MHDLGAAEGVFHARFDGGTVLVLFDFPAEIVTNFANLVVYDEFYFESLLLDPFFN